jgi:glycosyltransferase involved in cell wall biosynthesis
VPYTGVESSCWISVKNALVWYMRPQETSMIGLWRLITRTDYDVLYINSLFSELSIKVLFLRAMGFLGRAEVVLAPRGELSPGALEIKGAKKKIYLVISRLAGFYRDIIWHASTKYEADDISRIFPKTLSRFGMRDRQVRIAPDPFLLPENPFSATNPTSLYKEPGHLRIISISRITKKKNLEFAIRLLVGIKGCVQFDIYGPCEDPGYWDKCKSIIETLPSNVTVAYGGVVCSSEARDLFRRYHLFLFPTLGENFGHVIPEALSSGCLVLSSDQTPWRSLAKEKIGWDIGLDNLSGFQEALNTALDLNNEEFSRRSDAARHFMRKYCQKQTLELDELYTQLFANSPSRLNSGR